MITRSDFIINPALGTNPRPRITHIYCPKSGFNGCLGKLCLYGRWYISHCGYGIEEMGQNAWFDTGEEALDWFAEAANKRLEMGDKNE